MFTATPQRCKAKLYVSLLYGEILRDKLKAKFIILHNMSHFSGNDGIMELPIALESMLKLSHCENSL